MKLRKKYCVSALWLVRKKRNWTVRRGGGLCPYLYMQCRKNRRDPATLSTASSQDALAVQGGDVLAISAIGAVLVYVRAKCADGHVRAACDGAVLFTS